MIFPEAFIWHVFNSLARALLYCKNGSESETSTDRWEEIVCGDLKEANTLVCEPDTEYKLYPCLKLADFGTLLTGLSYPIWSADSSIGLAYPIPSREVRAFKQSTPWGRLDIPHFSQAFMLISLCISRYYRVRRLVQYMMICTDPLNRYRAPVSPCAV